MILPGVQDEWPEGSYMRVDTAAIRSNLAALRKKTSSVIMAVVKNDGYGLSLVEYARLLMQQGVTAFAAGTPREALMLRQSGFAGDLLLLTPQTALPVLRTLIEQDVMLTVGSLAQAEAARRAGKDAGKLPLAHVMIDTGLGRYGFGSQELGNAARALKNLYIAGTYTHFSSSYTSTKETERQYRFFLQAVEMLHANDVNPGLLHCCASGAALNYPWMHMDMVRIGSALLGRVPRPGIYGLGDAVCLVTPLADIREIRQSSRAGYNGAVRLRAATRIGIVNAGPADGFVQQKRCLGLLPIRQYADVGGKKALILGNLGVNGLAIDLSGIHCGENEPVSLHINPIFCMSGISRRFE